MPSEPRAPRAAVIGCGDVSVAHLDALAGLDIELVAVCDTDADQARRTGAERGVPALTDLREMIAATGPDVVHVCTPHDQHVSVALAAMELGVHVLTEKPLAHTVAQGQRLVDAADAAFEAHGTKVGVCFQNRYNAPNRAMHEAITSGTFGRVLGASASVPWHRSPEYYRAKPWRGSWDRSGGGLLINQAIHTIDLVQWLLGDVEKVRGHAATHVLGDVIEVEDTAELVLEHRGGVRSVMHATLANSVNAPVTVEVVTENATLTMRGDLTITHADGRADVTPERTVITAGRSYWGKSHALLIADFYARLEDPEPFWIDPREAAKSLAILKDVYAQSPGLGYREPVAR